jgi:hypothetical protein
MKRTAFRQQRSAFDWLPLPDIFAAALNFLFIINRKLGPGIRKYRLQTPRHHWTSVRRRAPMMVAASGHPERNIFVRPAVFSLCGKWGGVIWSFICCCAAPSTWTAVRSSVPDGAVLAASRHLTTMGSWSLSRATYIWVRQWRSMVLQQVGSYHRFRSIHATTPIRHLGRSQKSNGDARGLGVHCTCKSACKLYPMHGLWQPLRSKRASHVVAWHRLIGSKGAVHIFQAQLEKQCSCQVCISLWLNYIHMEWPFRSVANLESAYRTRKEYLSSLFYSLFVFLIKLHLSYIWFWRDS